MRILRAFSGLVATLLVASVLGLASPVGAAPGGAAGAGAASDRVGKGDLLTLEEMAVFFPDLERKGFFQTYRFPLRAPDWSTGPLHCDRYRDYGGTSRILGSYYSVAGRAETDSISTSLVTMPSVAAARGVVQHYRSWVRICRGLHDTTDGESGYAQMRVRGWSPRDVGRDSVGVLDAYIQYGDTWWTRTVVTRVGATVLVMEAGYKRGTGTARPITEAVRAARAKLS